MISFGFVMVVFAVGIIFGIAISFRIMGNALAWYMNKYCTENEIKTIRSIYETVKARKGLRREK